MDGLLDRRESPVDVRLLGLPTWEKNGLVTVISVRKEEKRDRARRSHQDIQRPLCLTREFRIMVECGDFDRGDFDRKRTVIVTGRVGKEETNYFSTLH